MVWAAHPQSLSGRTLRDFVFRPVYMHIIGQTMKRINIRDVCVCMTDKHDAGLAAAAGLRPISDLSQSKCWYRRKLSPWKTELSQENFWYGHFFAN